MLRRLLIVTLSVFAMASATLAAADNPKVRMTTNLGVIDIELLEKLSPLTVANFLGLVDQGFYNGLIFHRVIANFVIQGGGYTPDMQFKSGAKTVPNESFNGVQNAKGTVAMARLPDPDSADTQFFINVRDNPNLDAAGQRAGYTVFGRVIAGMDVVEQIELVNTHLYQGLSAVPVDPIIIEKAERI